LGYWRILLEATVISIYQNKYNAKRHADIFFRRKNNHHQVVKNKDIKKIERKISFSPLLSSTIDMLSV